VRLEGAELQSAREVALHWVFEPAAEAVWDGLPPVEERSSEEMRRALAALDRIGWPPTPPLAVAEARLARALLERIGWPGEALRLILIDGAEALSLRRGAYRQLAASAGGIDEAASLVVEHHGSWEGALILLDFDQARGLLDRLGWQGQ